MGKGGGGEIEVARGDWRGSGVRERQRGRGRGRIEGNWRGGGEIGILGTVGEWREQQRQEEEGWKAERKQRSREEKGGRPEMGRQTRTR